MRTISAARAMRLGLAMAAIFLVASAGEAKAGGVLWYNGDFDGNGDSYNEVVPRAHVRGSVFDDFIVPAGQTWTIQSVFSNDMMNFTPRSLYAFWQIRSGVSNGDGGTLLASGAGIASQSATGTSFGDLLEYTVTVSGLSVVLGPGTYCLTVDPVGRNVNNDVSYIATTSGANAIGMPPGNDGNSYLAGSYHVDQFGSNYVPAGDSILNPNGGQPDFSMGVSGIAVLTVPEPSTLVMGLTGALALVGGGRLRRRFRAG